MRWINGLTSDAKHRLWVEKLESWQRWFAWYPKTVDITEDQHKIKVWLQFIERKGKFLGHSSVDGRLIIRYEYREIPQ